jgi:RNA polymerase sigma-70 factor (sigma-E family)
MLQEERPLRRTPLMSSGRDAEFTEYMSARMLALRRLARLLCQDWTRADDLLQAAMTKTYEHWSKAARADNTDAYVRAIVVREFVRERRASWAQRVSLTDQPPERAVGAPDHERILDLQAAVAALPPRQRAVLVLRYYCDLNVYQAAQALDCTPGTVKSQTAKALHALRRVMGEDYGPSSRTRPNRTVGHASAREVDERA